MTSAVASNNKMALSVPDQVTSIGTIIYLDSSGDLNLQVGPEQQNYVVCSKTMERASPVWKKMLSGGFAESKPLSADTKWVVTLPEDEPEPMLIVLNIIHSRFSLVPEKVTVLELYRILVLTDKYDITDLTRPWARQWMNCIRKTHSPLLMWIAWALGDATMFVVTADMLVMRCTVDPDGRLVTPKGWYLDEERFDALRPHDIIDRITALRLQLLTDILAPLDVLISKLKKEKSDCCALCDITMLGSLIISAANSGLDPIPRSGSEFRGSVNELVEKLDGLMVVFPHERKKTVDPLPPLRSLTQQTIKNKQQTVPGFFMDRLVKQGMKIGLLQ